MSSSNIKVKATIKQPTSCQSWVHTQSGWSQSNEAANRLPFMGQHSVSVVPAKELPVMVEYRQGFGAEGCS